MLPAVKTPSPLPIDVTAGVGTGAAAIAGPADAGTAGFAQALQRAKAEPAAVHDRGTRDAEGAAKPDGPHTESHAATAQDEAKAPADAPDGRESTPRPAARDTRGDEAPASTRASRPAHRGTRATTRAAVAPEPAAMPRNGKTTAHDAIAAAPGDDHPAVHATDPDDRARRDACIDRDTTSQAEATRDRPPGVDAIDPASIGPAQPSPTLAAPQSPSPITPPATPPAASPIAPPVTPPPHRLAAAAPKATDAAAANGAVEPAAAPPARTAAARGAHDARPAAALRGEATTRAAHDTTATTPASTETLQQPAAGERSAGERLEPAAARGAAGDAATPFAARLHERRGIDAAIAGSAGAAGRSEAAHTTATPAADRPAALHATLHTAVDDAGFGPALGTQVAVWVRDGVQEAQLRLHPAELGPVTVRIALDGNAAQVDFSAAAPATRTSIEQSLPALAAALRESGFTLTGGGVHDRAGGGDAGSPQRRGGGDGRGRGRIGAVDGGDLDAAGGRAAVPQRVGRSLVDLYA